jgi:mRNA-degrading endonuclease RelE of RelBE toxin-antitoxin system
LPAAGPRYTRIGDYRLVATFEDDRLIVLVLRVGRRREVYG